VDVSQQGNRITVPEEGLLSALEQVESAIHKVVVIEDNPDSGRLNRAVSSRRAGNMRFTWRRAGAEGILMVERVKPDLVITDLMMPDFDGFKIIDALKADEKHTDIRSLY